MDGREIAERVYGIVTDPERNWETLSVWCGVMIACLLEYQKQLEEAGISTYRGPERRKHERRQR